MSLQNRQLNILANLLLYLVSLSDILNLPSMKKVPHFYEDIRKILHEARQKAYASINSEMVKAYWQIGKRIVEEEQRGNSKRIMVLTYSESFHGD
jgi:hypothetical protein